MPRFKNGSGQTGRTKKDKVILPQPFHIAASDRTMSDYPLPANQNLPYLSGANKSFLYMKG